MGDHVHAERREPATPQGALDLGDAGRRLLAQAGELSAGRVAETLTPGAGAPLKQTLLALLAGRELDRHRAPGPATIQVLQGRVTLRTDGTELEVPDGAWAAIPDGEHDLRADADAVVLLTVVMPDAG